MGRIVETDWLLSAATVIGKGHVDGGLPNQDYVGVSTSPDGKIIAAVVSDGAGTAPKSAIGSRTTVEFLVPWLLMIGEDVHGGQLSQSLVGDRLMKGILELRERLAHTGIPLREFHCTLVACVITPSGGFVCQIGDSIGLATQFLMLDDTQPSRVDFFPDDRCVRYETERGEYSNETHFITEGDWTKHLRVKELPVEFDAVVLMTDGAMDIVTTKGKVFRGFLSNLVGTLVSTPNREARNATIRDWLADPQTYPVTGDDKTLFLAIRAGSRSLANLPVFVGDDSDTATTIPENDHVVPHTYAAHELIPKATHGNRDRKSDVETPMRLPPPLPRRRRLIELGLLTVCLVAAIIAVARLDPLQPKTDKIENVTPGEPHAKPAPAARASSAPALPPPASTEPAEEPKSAPPKEDQPLPNSPPNLRRGQSRWSITPAEIHASSGDSKLLTVGLDSGGNRTIKVGAIKPPSDEVKFEEQSIQDCRAVKVLTLDRHPSCEVRIKVAPNARAGRYSTTITAYEGSERSKNGDQMTVSIVITERPVVSHAKKSAEIAASNAPPLETERKVDDTSLPAVATSGSTDKNREGLGK